MRTNQHFAILFACLVVTSAACAQDFKVTLLGTGSPLPIPDRFGAATLVEAGKEKLLFDVGRGATIRLNQIGVPIGAINAVFLTHFHSDHTSGMPDLWLTGWIGRYYGNRQSPFRVIGPKGTLSLMQNLQRAYDDDIRIRYEDEKNPLEGVAVVASEYANDGVVYETNGVKVTAFEVDHGPLIKPAYGYRIDFDGRSVIISGDTRYSENLEKHAQGATLVIHEVAIPNQEYYEKTPIVKLDIQLSRTEEGGKSETDPIVKCFETLGLVVASADGDASQSELERLAQFTTTQKATDQSQHCVFRGRPMTEST